jgi:hypothetical protein
VKKITSQTEKFINDACALGADQSEAEFAAVLKRVGSYKPPPGAKGKRPKVKKPDEKNRT